MRRRGHAGSGAEGKKSRPAEREPKGTSNGLGQVRASLAPRRYTFSSILLWVGNIYTMNRVCVGLELHLRRAGADAARGRDGWTRRISASNAISSRSLSRVSSSKHATWD